MYFVCFVVLHAKTGYECIQLILIREEFGNTGEILETDKDFNPYTMIIEVRWKARLNITRARLPVKYNFGEQMGNGVSHWQLCT